MTTSRRGFLAATLAIAATAGLSACGASSNDSASTSDKPLVILASSTPHAELLKQVQTLNLLGDVKITVREITGEIDPNQILESGDVDANFFQHVPYLTSWQTEHGTDDLVSVASTHVEPLGLYSKKVTDLASTPEGATIAVPQDVTNYARGLFLLRQAGLITLDVKPGDADLDYSQVTEKNITGNPKNFTFLQVDRPQLPATLDDAKVTLSVINGNYALEAGLKPATDSLAIESADNNPYANILVVRKALETDARVTKVAEALTSPEIKKWITDTYEGSVVPAS